ncbi:MAG: hypothetical protein GXO09_02775 [Crenarchaeota archaeon]|nr:hypothetical protein [Thermoproteota archaeon]
MVSQRSEAVELPATVAWVIRRLGLRASDILGQSRGPRVRIQKIVYILRAAGIEAYKAFEYGMYAYGPYSPSLAVIYYMLARQGDEAIERFASLHNPTPLEEELVEWLRGKEEDWLEAAATILMILDESPELAKNIKKLVKEVRKIKPWIDKKTLTTVARELIERNLIPT